LLCLICSCFHHGCSPSSRAPFGPALDDFDPGYSGSQPASRRPGPLHPHARQCLSAGLRPAAGIFRVGILHVHAPLDPMTDPMDQQHQRVAQPRSFRRLSDPDLR
jgi:hypothetical protein